jgi:O-antigen/teichoic acid export membrane protein
LLDKSLKYLALLVFPFVFAAVTFAPEILNLWLGPVFAAQGASVLRWLAVGVFFNSIAQIPFALIQSAGRPDLTAKLHLIELPGYGGALVWFIHTHGIEGAALAWTLRSAVDSIALLFLMKRTITYPVFGRRRLRIALGGLLVVVLAAVIHGFTYKVVFFLISLSGFASAAWYIALSGSERQRIQQYL